MRDPAKKVFGASAAALPEIIPGILIALGVAGTMALSASIRSAGNTDLADKIDSWLNEKGAEVRSLVEEGTNYYHQADAKVAEMMNPMTWNSSDAAAIQDATDTRFAASIPQADGKPVPVEGIDDIIGGITIDVDSFGLGAIQEIIRQAILMSPESKCRIVCAMMRGMYDMYGNEVFEIRPMVRALSDVDRSGAGPLDLQRQYAYLNSWARKFGCSCGDNTPVTG